MQATVSPLFDRCRSPSAVGCCALWRHWCIVRRVHDVVRLHTQSRHNAQAEITHSITITVSSLKAPSASPSRSLALARAHSHLLAIVQIDISRRQVGALSAQVDFQRQIDHVHTIAIFVVHTRYK